jgi:hypothetical protein
MAREFGRVFKLFAVDGLHTEGHTLHDLHLAEAMLADGGMVILDDWKYGCPAVVDAAGRFVDEGRFAPVAYGFNKMWLAQNEYIGAYQDVRLHQKAIMMFEYDRTFPQVGPSDPYNPGDWFEGEEGRNGSVTQ